MSRFVLWWKTFATKFYINELEDYIQDHEKKNLNYKLRKLIPFKNTQREYEEALEELKDAKVQLGVIKNE